MRASQVSLGILLVSTALLAACGGAKTETGVRVEPPVPNAAKQNAKPPEQKKVVEDKRAESKAKYDAAAARIKAKGVKPVAKADPKKDLRKRAPTAKKQGGPKGSYQDFYDGVIGGGKPVVLFFYSAWSPKSDVDDKQLTVWYTGDNRPELSTYKIDFESAEELRKEYRVTSGHTYVKIDPRGRMIGKVFAPSSQELFDFLQS